MASFPRFLSPRSANFARIRYPFPVWFFFELAKRKSPSSVGIVRCGVWVKRLPNNRKVIAIRGNDIVDLHSHDCHLVFDLNEVSTSRGKFDPAALFDSRSIVPDEVRRTRISSEMEKTIFPLFHKLSSAEMCCKNKPDSTPLLAWSMQEFCTKIAEGIDIRQTIEVNGKRGEEGPGRFAGRF